MIGLTIKLIQDGKVMDELEITNIRKDKSQVKTVIKNYEQDGSTEEYNMSWWDVRKQKLDWYSNACMSNEYLELHMQSFLYDEKTGEKVSRHRN